MEKVKITRKLAESLINARKRCTDEDILYALSQSDVSYSIGDKRGRALIDVIKARGNTPLLQIAAALINGYEIEKTPTEIVNERIEEIKGTTVVFREDVRLLDAEMDGIKLVVDAFGIRGIDA